MHNSKNILQQVFTRGTIPCAIACTLLGLFTALLLLWGGIWRTLLVAALAIIGAFIGGVKDKKSFIDKFR